MNRTGLLVVLAIGVAIGVIFAAFPELDIKITGLFFDPASRWFGLTYYMFVDGHMWVLRLRDATMWMVAALAFIPVAALILKLLRPTKPMLMSPRSIVFLLGTLALAPGVLANGVLKEHWARPRPIEVREFTGSDRFVPWWDPRGDCPNNCSFVAGEPSGAFWTLAPAALAPPPLQAVAYGAALAFGVALGGFRMAAGAHFFSDVVFAGVLMYLVIWIAYGLIYRWPATRLDEKVLEDRLGQLGEGLSGLAGRLASRWKKAS